MPVATVALIRYSDEECAEARRSIDRANSNGTILELPDWMFDAKRQRERENKRVARDAKKSGKPHQNKPLRCDGTIDAIAVELAVTTARPLRMTRNEKLLAASRLRGRGADVMEIAERLGMDTRTVNRYFEAMAGGALDAIKDAIESGDLEVSPDPSALYF
jgi:hypothetical protein